MHNDKERTKSNDEKQRGRATRKSNEEEQRQTECKLTDDITESRLFSRHYKKELFLI